VGEWDDEVGIVIVGGKTMSTEIDDLMLRGAELAGQFLLQAKSTVIGGDSDSHVRFSTVCRNKPYMRGSRASTTAPTTTVRGNPTLAISPTVSARRR
jgi:hypothetical protein